MTSRRQFEPLADVIAWRANLTGCRWFGAGQVKHGRDLFLELLVERLCFLQQACDGFRIPGSVVGLLADVLGQVVERRLGPQAILALE